MVEQEQGYLTVHIFLGLHMCGWYIQLMSRTTLHKKFHFFTCCLFSIAFILCYYFIYFILGDVLLFGIYCGQQRKHFIVQGNLFPSRQPLWAESNLIETWIRPLLLSCLLLVISPERCSYISPNHWLNSELFVFKSLYRPVSLRCDVNGCCDRIINLTWTSDFPQGHETFSYLQYILIDGVPEVQKCLFIKLLPVNDAHLFEECRLSALPGPEEEDLDQPAHGSPLPGEHRVYLPAPPPRLALLRRVPLPAPLLAAARLPAGLRREEAAAQGADHSRHVEKKKFTETSGGKCSL